MEWSCEPPLCRGSLCQITPVLSSFGSVRVPLCCGSAFFFEVALRSLWGGGRTSTSEQNNPKGAGHDYGKRNGKRNPADNRGCGRCARRASRGERRRACRGHRSRAVNGGKDARHVRGERIG